MDFLLGVISDSLGNIVTAFLVYLLIERKIKSRDENAARIEREREVDRRVKETKHLLNATLLQQLPPLIQKVLETQRDSFAHGILVRSHYADLNGQHAAESVNTLRYTANVHSDSVQMMECLAVDVTKTKWKYDLTNLIANAALELLREGKCRDVVTRLYPRYLERVRTTVPPDAPYCSHLDRLVKLLDGFDTRVNEFNTLDARQRSEFLSTLCEATGHLSHLLLVDLLDVYRNRTASLRTILEEAPVG